VKSLRGAQVTQRDVKLAPGDVVEVSGAVGEQVQLQKLLFCGMLPLTAGQSFPCLATYSVAYSFRTCLVPTHAAGCGGRVRLPGYYELDIRDWCTHG
jgi:hypothetical protein